MRSTILDILILLYLVRVGILSGTAAIDSFATSGSMVLRVLGSQIK